MSADLRCQLGRLSLKNPVMPASGCFDWYPEHDGPFHPDELGAVVLKSTTLQPRDGNIPIRLAETPSGMLNAIGIPSYGLEGFRTILREKWSRLKTPVIASISAFTPEEYAILARELGKEPTVAALEINLSCPNLEHGVIPAQDPVLLRECVEAVREATEAMIIAKLSPNVTDIVEMASISESAGADAICLINSIRGMEIDIWKKKPILGRGTGGLSGPAIKPIALAMVYEVCGAVKVPVIGVGGISRAEDAIAFLLAGASAVQVGTISFRDPLAMRKIITGIREYLDSEGYTSVTDIIGLARTDT
ncbi:dihydroorotate dehydrogenase [Collibacillus ludicampi]|uniref:Dihydroorotate dehydrogenase n=1 Tax=Collibacillus ludicampi TaxID=2771369 RepID=A0AAV4LJR7_9BACL|nr:dihydroorotate dehydrogenase [Collibacillus ludicampi]GIM48019.1 dihydroorotate dehydrogenase [Collibacillus ludicampi]